MSSRKSPLLSEGTVRRFMKLATLDNLTENFVDTLEEEGVEAELHATEDELGHEDHVADEEGAELDALEDEAPAADVDPETVEALVSAIADAVADVTGVDVSVEGGAEELPMDAEGEPAVEDEVEVDTDVVVDEEPLEEKQGAVDKEDEHLGAEDGPERDKKQSLKDRRKEMRGEDRAEGDHIPGTKQEGREIPADLVEELTRRVAARLVREAKK